MNFNLCAINSKFVHSSLAVWYLKSAIDHNQLLNSKIKTNIIESTINQDFDTIYSNITGNNPDIIGLSCYIWNISIVKKLLYKLSTDMPSIKIILGGPEVSYNFEELLDQFANISHIIIGEGENVITQLLENILYANPDISDISGLAYKYKDSIVYNPQICSKSEPISPYTEEYLSTLNKRIVYLETSRGCPFSCSFCLSGQNESVRFFSLEEAKSNILKLANSGTQTIKLVDRTFNCNPERAYEIILFLIENYSNLNNVCFHFEVGADLFDEKTINLLSKAPKGLIQIEAGLQSFYEKTLKAVNRVTDLEKLKNNISAIISSENIHVHIDLIAGLPYEDFEQFSHSFDDAYILKPHMLQLGFLKMLHGSTIRSQAELYNYKYNIEPPYEIIENSWINNTEILELKNIEDVLDRMYNSGRFSRTLEYLEKCFKRPFDIFQNIAKALECKNLHNISLDVYIEYIFEFLSAQDNINSNILRDCIAIDYISIINTGKLPKCLYIKDKRLKTIAQNHSIKSTKQGFVVLYSSKLYNKYIEHDIDFNRDIYAVINYDKKNPVTNQYKINWFNF